MWKFKTSSWITNHDPLSRTLLELFFCTLYVFKLFHSRMNKPNIYNNIISISSFQNGHNDLIKSTCFYFKTKVMEGSHKGKNNVFFLSLGTFFQIVYFWSSELHFSVAVHIHVFDEPFFLLTIRTHMATKLFMVVTCSKELSPINMYDTSIHWSCWVTWQIKFKKMPN